MKYYQGSPIGPVAAFSAWGLSSATGMTVQSAAQGVAIRFFADATESITAFDVRLAITGTTTGITIKGHIETDNLGVPSGTTVGAATPAFSCPAATGTVGLQTFATAASLTAGVAYWLILLDGGGTAPTASNYYQLEDSGFNNGTYAGGLLRQYNGSNWTTTALVTSDGIFILEDSSGNYHGFTTISNPVASSRTAVYGTNYIGVRMKFSVPVNIYGARVSLRFSGSPPGNCELVLTQDGGPALATSSAIVSGSFATNTYVIFVFNGGTPVQVPANVNIYLLLHQVGGTGASGTSYTLSVVKPVSTYISAMTNSDWREASGSLASNNADPSTLTLSTDEIPEISAIIVNPNGDLISSGGGTIGSSFS